MRKKIFLGVVSFCLTGAMYSQNLNVTLAGRLSYPGQTCANICGYVDSLGNEYALVGASNGMSIVNVSNPAAPFEVAQIPVPNPGSYNNLWREIKVLGKYAYVTTEAGGGLQIVDMRKLPGTNLPYVYWAPTLNGQTLGSIHALHIDEAKGKVYLYGSNVSHQGAIIADIATNPMSPIYLGMVDNRYIHDGYVRNDTLYACHIYDGDCEILNCTNPASPVSIGDFQTPNLFTHNAWLSADSKVCFTTDETDNSFLTAYDISNLNNITELDRIQSNPGSNSDVHNTHIIQKNGVDYAVTSWYNDGFTIVDASRPFNLVQVGNYDTSPTVSGSGMARDWGVYPFLPSGTIIASDIDSGLFVCTPNYVRACYLEGVVVNCNTGAAISGVTVTIQVPSPPQCNSYLDVSDFQGKYEAGAAVPGTYTVTFSKVGFTTGVDTVHLSAGVVKIDTLKLCPSPTFTYTGMVFDNVTSAGIAGAHVSVFNANSRWDTITDANGNYSFHTIYDGNYSVAAGKWGYITKSVNNQNLTYSSPPMNIGLAKGLYDDFMWDYGWTVSGNATQGMWVRDVPLGTPYQSTFANPNVDVPSDCGYDAYVTGNTGVTSSDDDVDGGATVLMSPTFDLTSYSNPYIFYSRWKALYGGTTDSVAILLSNGVSTVVLEDLFYNSPGQSQWVNRNYRISPKITPTANMNVIVIASDNGPDNIVEAGFDKFFIKDSANSAVESINEDQVFVKVYPNPFSENAILRIMNSPVKNYELKVYDMYGKEVSVNAVRTSDGFVIRKSNLAAGIYFYHIIAGNEAIAEGKLCVE